MLPAYNYQQIRENLVLAYYLAIYRELLPDEGKKASLKKPFEIGNKDVYALSDIEGNNRKFLDFLQQLGLVQYTTNPPLANNKEWIQCETKGNPGIVWYKFNETACRTFKNVIVLCGDCIGHENFALSEGTLKILKKLDQLLNNNGKAKDGNKRLFLVAGNHDIFDHGETYLNSLKEEVFNLGLYPQLMLMNGCRQRLLFQHTNFPYMETNNFIRNKTIDVNKAKTILKNSVEKPGSSRLFDGKGYFLLRCEMRQDGPYYTPTIYEGEHAKELDRNLYSDHGMGYDAKFIGHDPQGIDKYNRDYGRGDLLSCHIANTNFRYWKCPALAKGDRQIDLYPKKYQYIYETLDKLFKDTVTKENTRSKFCLDICNELLNKNYL